MSMNRQGRESGVGETAGLDINTFTGNRALQLEEPLLFEKGGLDRSGVDLPDVPRVASRLCVFPKRTIPSTPGYFRSAPAR